MVKIWRVDLRKRESDYMAFINSDKDLWGAGSTPNEAIGNVVKSHVDDYSEEPYLVWVCSYCHEQGCDPIGDPVKEFDSEHGCELHCDANHGMRANAKPIQIEKRRAPLTKSGITKISSCPVCGGDIPSGCNLCGGFGTIPIREGGHRGCPNNCGWCVKCKEPIGTLKKKAYKNIFSGQIDEYNFTEEFHDHIIQITPNEVMHIIWNQEWRYQIYELEQYEKGGHGNGK
jgi:hypothetical protein